MGTWVKETDDFIYLMQGNSWISRIQKKPSPSNPKEKAMNVEGMRQWFDRADFPRAMTVSVGTGQPEPTQAGGGGSAAVIPTPSKPDDGTSGGNTGDTIDSNYKGAKLRVKSSTFFKLQPKMASELTDAEKELVNSGSEFPVQYYIDVGKNHWQVTLLNPLPGTQNKTWFVYIPDVALDINLSLTVVSDTLFKAEPKLSTQLTADQKVFVKNGTRYQLLDKQLTAGNHLEIELADATLGPKDDNKWFVYAPDVKVNGQRQILQVRGDTIFKAKPVQSSQLADGEKVLVKKGTIFLLNSYAYPEANHVRVSLEGAFLGPKNLTTWYAYAPDIAISGTEIGNNPKDSNPGQPANPADRGIALTFPGIPGTYYSNDPILPNWDGKGTRGHFTWAEALKFDANGNYRKPVSASAIPCSAENVVYGVLKIAKALEEARLRIADRYGEKPLIVNSWYRDPATNKSVGGVYNSRHLAGDAVDFTVPGVPAGNIYALLFDWWYPRGGIASSWCQDFTHLDAGPTHRKWNYPC
jgi:hypothetical protein